jgi:hypothetical protein
MASRTVEQVSYTGMQCLESTKSMQASKFTEVNREATGNAHSHRQRWVGGLNLHVQGGSTLAFQHLMLI